jgi:hypothetical protein
VRHADRRWRAADRECQERGRPARKPHCSQHRPRTSTLRRDGGSTSRPRSTNARRAGPSRCGSGSRPLRPSPTMPLSLSAAHSLDAEVIRAGSRANRRYRPSMLLRKVLRSRGLSRSPHPALRSPVGMGLNVLLEHGCQPFAEVRDLVSCRRESEDTISPIAVDFRGLSARVPPEESAGLTRLDCLPPRQCLTSTYADGGSPPSPIRLPSHIRETRRDNHQAETLAAPCLFATNAMV